MSADFLRNWLARWTRRPENPAKEAIAKAWLDRLRHSELSVSAQRRLNPQAAVKAPGIGQGTAQASATAPINFTASKQRRKSSLDAVSVYIPGDTSTGDGSDCDSSSSDSGSCGGDAD